MKYIMFSEPGGMEIPVLFPDFVNHSTVAAALKTNNQFVLTPISAGFCSQSGDVSCWGGSTSLGLSSKTQDSLIINKMR